jgi:L-2-hydroxyglutarate oxidase LhgO
MTAGDLDTDVVVVGAGVAGLAVAMELAATRGIVVVERHESPARETSAHNSGVIHAGIYYPTGSLKHRLCIAGNRAMYAWCAERGVPARNTGKLIARLEGDPADGLDAVLAQARANEVPELRALTAAEARELEPAVPATAAIFSGSTGIVDAASYARSLETVARERGALFAYRHEVLAAERGAEAFTLTLRDPDGAESRLRAGVLVNAAGLGAPALAAALGLPLDGDERVPRLRQYPNRGRYYDVTDTSASRRLTRLVYPLPRHDLGGLGVHATVDLDGGLHFGPDAEWLPEGAPLDYRNDDTRRAEFLAAARRILPELRDEQIAPGQVGYRPKRNAPGEEEADFLVWHDRGYVHLGGIESPGLTASLPLAGEVARLLR